MRKSAATSKVPRPPSDVLASKATENDFGTIRSRRQSRRLGRPTLLVGMASDDARAALVHTRGSVAAVPVIDGVFVLRDFSLAPPTANWTGRSAADPARRVTRVNAEAVGSRSARSRSQSATSWWMCSALVAPSDPTCGSRSATNRSRSDRAATS